MLDNDKLDKLVELLQRQTRALEEIAASKTNTYSLGFNEPPTPTYVYVRNEGEYLWYFYDVEKQQATPIHQRALTGTIVDLRLTAKDFKGKENIKLDVWVNADKLYVVRSGLETVFSRTMLLALAQLTLEQLRQVVIISVQAGENCCFGRVYINDEPIKTEWDAKADVFKMIKTIQDRLGVHHPLPTDKEPWRTWKNKQDSLVWAATKLPTQTSVQLNQLFDNTPANANGKKAYAFYQRVEEMTAEIAF